MFLQLQGEATALKLENKKRSTYAGCLLVLGSHTLCYKVIAYICSAMIVLRREQLHTLYWDGNTFSYL